MVDLIFGIFVLGGLGTTLAVFTGFVVRSIRLKIERTFPSQERPGDLSGFPLVTIIIPARNEERNIASCLESLCALDYPRFEIIVVDDRSTDRTAEIVRTFIEPHASRPDVRLLPLGDVQGEGGVEWAFRKSQALWHGAQQANGEWLLFLDADTRQKPDTLWRALNLARQHSLDALSISGTFVNTGLWGGVLEAVMTPAIFCVIPWHRVNDPADPVAWMNGNFILYRRRTYFSVDGHRAIAGHIQDDLALALQAKKRNVRFLFLPISSAYECRDYMGLREAFHGWVRRLAAGGARLHLGRRSYLLAAGVLFFTAVWPVMFAAVGLLDPFTEFRILGFRLHTWILAQLGVVILFQGIIRNVMKMSVWPAVFAPLGAAFGIAAALGGYRARFVKRTVDLRGREIPIEEDVD